MKYLLRARHSATEFSVGGHPVFFVNTGEKVEQALRILADAKVYGLDTEFYGYNLQREHPYGRARMASMQFSARGPKLKGVREAKYIFVPNWGEYEGLARHFRKELYADNGKKVLHNVKADLHPLENHGIKFRGLKADTQIMCHHHDAAFSHGLKEQVNREFDLNVPSYDEAFRFPKLKKNGEPGKQTTVASPLDLVEGKFDWFYKRKNGGLKALVEYAVKDPDLTLDLYERKCDQLSKMQWYRDKSMLDYYYEFDNDYIMCLYEMERIGVPLNEEFLLEIQSTMTKAADELDKAFFKMCVKLGADTRVLEELNVSSNVQLGRFLVKQFGIDLPESAKKKDVYSVSNEALQEVRSPRYRKLIKAILELRNIRDKLLGTYIEPWLHLIHDRGQDGRLRTQFKYPGPITRRLSSATPNLQNIPRYDPDGRESDKYGIRKAFVSPSDDEEIGDIDLSQIELRLAAHFSNDPVMIEAFKHDWDLHARTAMFAYPEVADFAKGKQITAELLAEIKKTFEFQRQSSKTVGFTVMYGGGPMRVMDETGCSKAEGRRIIRDFFRGYAGLDACMKKQVKYCRQYGHIRTLLRSYIHIPDIAHWDPKIRGAAERKPWNYTIQGSAAELLKMSMVLVYRDDRLRDWGVKMPLTIHDELLFFVPKGVKDKAGPIIEDYVAHPYRHFGMKDLRVDTPAVLGFGLNWLEAKKDGDLAEKRLKEAQSKAPQKSKLSIKPGKTIVFIKRSAA